MGRTQMGLPLEFLEGSCQGRRKIRTWNRSVCPVTLDKSAFWPKEIVSEINSSKLILPSPSSSLRLRHETWRKEESWAEN